MFNRTSGEFRNQPVHLSTDINDVYTSSLNNGDMLVHSTTNNRWYNANVNYKNNKFGAQEIVIDKLDYIGDVNATSPNNNDILTYSTSTSTWNNTSVSSATGISVSSPLENQELIYNSAVSKFENQQIDHTTLSNIGTKYTHSS